MTDAQHMATLMLEEQLQLIDALHVVLTMLYGTPPLYGTTKERG